MKKIPKLKLHLWQEIIYFLLVVGAPAAITSVELFQTHSTMLKISFTSVGALLITLVVIKKFFINSKIEKVRKKIIALEHDYSIEVGNPDNCRQQWAIYNLFIFVYNAACVILALVLLVIFVNALIKGLMAFRGAAVIILLCVFIGIMFKIVCYLVYARERKEKNK